MELQSVLRWIGYRNLILLGLSGSLYFISGYWNFLGGIPFLSAFSPYYALHLHDISRWLAHAISSLEKGYMNSGAAIEHFFREIRNSLINGFDRQIAPFLKTHPIMGIFFFLFFGFSQAILATAFLILGFQKMVYWLSWGGTLPFPAMGFLNRPASVWIFDPLKKPSDEQLKEFQKKLERIAQRAMAMSGLLPKGADLSIRELAVRNRGTDYNYRNAIYVTGPIPGTRFDRACPFPLSLDQVKEISAYMGQAAWHESLPLDLVVLRCRKGMKEWERVTAIPATGLAPTPMKIVEKVMYEYRNSFCWDPRATKASVGYGDEV
ncbi:MAG: hypothetical protein ACE15F_16765 [bacterium]